MPMALLALAVAAFGIGTTEFVMMGLLPSVADDLGTSVPTAGYLVSAYALGVVIGAPLLTAAGVRVPRRRMLIWLMALFAAGNLASALAPGFTTVLIGRVLAGLPHGAFFGVGAVVATQLVAPERRGRAVATMFLGLTVANIFGVPAGTALGQQFGWRSTFLVVTAIGLLAMAALWLLVPRLPLERGTALGAELRALANRQVLLGLLTAVFGFSGVFAVYSYLAKTVTEVTGLADSSVTWVLALFGIGMTLGAFVAGPLTDRALRPTLYGSLAALSAALVLFHFTAEHTVAAMVTVAVIGAVGFMTTTPLQMLLMNAARSAPTLASASNQSALNLANAAGAWIGGVVVSAGWGWTSPTLAGAVLALLGLALALIAGALDLPGRSVSRVVSKGASRGASDVPAGGSLAPVAALPARAGGSGGPASD